MVVATNQPKQSSNQYGLLPPSGQPRTTSFSGGSRFFQPPDNRFPTKFGGTGGFDIPGGVSDIPGAREGIGKGFQRFGPLSPEFTGSFYDFLFSQLGQGATPFGAATDLPTGGTTGTGEMSAGLNPLSQNFMDFLLGGDTSLAGLGTLGQMSETGMPISTMDQWQAMLQAQQRNIEQNQANLREEFAFSGNLEASPFGTAMTDFMSQTSLDQNALLAMMETQAMEQARGRQMGASQFLGGMTQAGIPYFQDIDQQAINRMYDEFIRTQPEYNPLMQQMFGAATTFPPIMRKGSGMGAVGGILSGAGSLAGSLSDIFRSED